MKTNSTGMLTAIISVLVAAAIGALEAAGFDILSRLFGLTRSPSHRMIMAGWLVFTLVIFWIAEKLALLAFADRASAGVSDTSMLRWWRSGRLSQVLCVIAALILAIDSFGTPEHEPSRPEILLTDFFHEGEILGSVPIIRHGADIPILIHGPGRDLLPAFLAVHLAEPGHEIAFTRLANGLGATATLLAMMWVAYVIWWRMSGATELRSNQKTLAFAMALFVVVMAILAAEPTNRHFLYVIAIGLCVFLVSEFKPRATKSLAAAAALGMICAVSPIYVYRLAFSTTILVALTLMFMIWRQRLSCLGLVAAGLGGAALAFGSMVIAGGLPLYGNAIRDIAWWAFEAGGIWTVRPTVSHLLIVLLIVATIGAGSYMAVHRLASRAPPAQRQGEILLITSIAAVLAIPEMTDRQDIPHIRFTMVSVSLCLSAMISAILLPRLERAGEKQLLVLTRAIGVTAAALILLFAFPGKGVTSLMAWNTADSAVLADDEMLFIRRHESRIASSNCLLVFTNEGVLNYVADKPPCGPFFYPIFGSVPLGDARLAEWLQSNPQRIAILKTDFWSDDIDDKPMADRMPMTYSVLKKMMPRQIKENGRVIITDD